jgi:hypothetical protein
MSRFARAVATVALALTAGGAMSARALQGQPPAQAPTETIWTCPIHAVVVEKDPGRCPICRRDLILVNATVAWTCAGRPDVTRPSPGKCPDGSAAEPKYTQEPHANHTPRHGGLFFMAPDNWHHIEGTFSRDGTFRLFFYDDYTKPLAPDVVKQVAGRIVIKETFDPATRTTKELAVAPLKPSASGETLEAEITGVTPPAELIAKLKFKADMPEYRFDFSFPGFTEDKPIGGVPELVLLEVPDDLGSVLQLFRERNRTIGDLVKKGSFGEVWVPALQAKDLALAMDVRVRELPAGRRNAATTSIERLVRAAWMLDEYGDIGNRQQVEEAYEMFAAAAAEIDRTFAPVAAREKKP